MPALIVEPSRIFQSMLVSFVKELGLDSVVAANGEGALASAATTPPALVCAA